MGRGMRIIISYSWNKDIEIHIAGVTSQGQQQVSGIPNSKADAISNILFLNIVDG